MEKIFYDFEVFKYDWLVVFKNYNNKEKTVVINDISKLKSFYENNKNNVFIGYNNRTYDQFILKGLLLGYNAFDLSKQIVEEDLKGQSIIKNSNSIPLITFDLSNKLKRLKEFEGFMGSKIKESSIDFMIDRQLTEEEIIETIEYCEHDVNETIKLFENLKEEFDSQILMIQAFDLPMEKFNNTKAQLSAFVLEAKKPKNNRGDDFNITIPNTLILDKYKFVLDWYNDVSNRDYNKQLICEIANVPHVFAWGGVHGAINGYNKDGNFISSDVASFYPALMIEYNFLSRNVKNINKYREIRDKRIQLKKEKNPIQAPLKIVLNSTYGAMKDEYNDLYDPLMANNVCVGGQLLLLDLIEKVEPYCKLIQSNTDGIFVEILDEEKYKEECNKWSKRTRMDLEHDKYIKCVQKDVNNYIIVDEKNKHKSKGAFVKQLSYIDYDLPIVNEALMNYFIKNIPLEDTILKCEEFIKFQKIVKITKLYKHALHNNVILKEKVLRVFASTNESDGTVYKTKNGIDLEKIGNTPEKAFIFNEEILNLKCPTNLDKNYYLDLAKDRLDKFTNTEYKEKSLNSGYKFISYNSLVELQNLLNEDLSILEILNKLTCNSRELESFIKMNFFKKYSKTRKILEFVKYYKLFNNKKQISIEKCDDLCMKYLEINCKKTNTKYTEINHIEFLEYLWDNILDEDLDLLELIKFQIECSGFINLEIPKGLSIAKVDVVSSKNEWHKLISLRNNEEKWFCFKEKCKKGQIIIFKTIDTTIIKSQYKRDIIWINDYKIIK